MTETSSSFSIIVLAGLLSLLPVVVLFWTYYLRERTPSVPGRVVTKFFALGMFTVVPAVLIERLVFFSAQRFSPVATSTLFAESYSLASFEDLLLAFMISFGVVALVEEAVRFLLLRFLLQQTPEVDQIIDGLQVGVASGIGFAFIENTLYFLRLLERLDFDTLAVVFFLRFLISTFGHIAFGGIMGYQLARAIANPLERRGRLLRAFLIPWVMHGLFDFFLSIQLSVYTVLFLLIPLFSLWTLYRHPRLSERFRLHGRLLRAPVGARPRARQPWKRAPVDPLPTIPWCPTCLTPFPRAAAHTTGGAAQTAPSAGTECSACGTRFTRPLPSAAAPLAPAPSR